jgi:hypothetical protein
MSDKLKRLIDAFLDVTEEMSAEEKRQVTRKAIARLTNSLRSVSHAGGRPSIPTPCKQCGEVLLSVTQARVHCRKSKCKNSS